MSLDTLIRGDSARGLHGDAQIPDHIRNRRLRRASNRPAPRWWRDVAGSLAWLSVIISAGLWVSNCGVQSFTWSADGLTSAGRLAGLLAANLLLILVIMMARIPFVERSFGQDELSRRHRVLGFLSFDLLCAHVVLIVLGYAASSRQGPWQQFWSLISSYPGMWLAAMGVVALAVVVITSVRLARKKIRYEAWHVLHLYAYAGVGLAWPHEVWTGTDFVISTVARTYWWVLWWAATGSILLYRVALPIWRSWRHRLVVSQVVREAPDVVSVHLTGRGLARMPVTAGQFLFWRFLDGPDWLQGHPYSLSAAPKADRLRITVKGAGDAYQRLARLRPGTRVLVEGPYGRLTAAVRTRRKITMIASGIGITPIRALLEELEYSPMEATLIYRASRTDDLVFREELEDLAKARGIRVFYVIGPRIPGRRSWLPVASAGWSDSAVLLKLVPDIAGHDVYICGKDSWMATVKDAVFEAGTPESNIHTERFDW
jgi:predicted ferric reductase